MERIDTNTITRALLTSPNWARTNLAASKDRLRQQAAEELACHIFGQLTASTGEAEVDPNQFGLDL